MQLHISAITFKCNSLKRILVQLTDKSNFPLKSSVITEICQTLSALSVLQRVPAEKLQGKVTASTHS